MPQIVRQNAKMKAPPPAVAKPIRRVVSTDSILSRAVDIEELTDCKYQIVFYGQNRIGKTTLACHFPKPLLLISLDPRSNGGADSVRRIPGIKNIRMGEHIRTSMDVEALGLELQRNCPFETVVVDGITSLEELLLAEICGWDQTADMLRFPKKGETPKVSSDQYLERSEQLRKRLRPFIDIKSCHMIYIGQEKDHNPPVESRKSALVRGPQVESLYGPAVGSGAARWLNNSCNFIIQLYYDKEIKVVRNKVQVGKIVTETEDLIETGRVVRRARLQLHQNFMAGCNFPYDEANLADIPEYVEAVTAKDMYDKIMQVANGIRVK